MIDRVIWRCKKNSYLNYDFRHTQLYRQQRRELGGDQGVPEEKGPFGRIGR